MTSFHPSKNRTPCLHSSNKNPMGLMTRSCFFGGCPKVINLMVFWKRPLNLSENLFHQHFRGIIVLLVGLDFHIGFIFFCSPNTPKKTWDVQRHIWQFLLGPFCFFSFQNAPNTSSVTSFQGKHPAGGLVVDFFFCRTELRICVAFKSERNLNVETERSRSVPSSRF